MNNLSKYDIANKLIAWQCIEELRTENAQLLGDNQQLGREVNDLRAELAGAAMRLKHSEERTEWLRKRLSRTDLWAGFWLLVWRQWR